MFGIFRGPRSEARRLNRDARAVIDAARASYRADVMARIASIVRDRLGEAAERCAGDAACLERVATHVQELHREARRTNDQVGLTAYTLIIIHLRADALGDDGAPARATIGSLLADWQHVGPAPPPADP